MKLPNDPTKHSVRRAVNGLSVSIVIFIVSINANAQQKCLGDKLSESTITRYDSAADRRIDDDPDSYLAGNGRFYVVKKQNVAVGYIFGTLHIPLAQVTFLPPIVHRKFAEATDLLVESDMSGLSLATLQETIASLKSAEMPMGTDRLDLLDQSTNGAFRQGLNGNAISFEFLAKMSSSRAMDYLGVPACTVPWQRTNPNPRAIDILLTTWARGFDRDVASIEPFGPGTPERLFGKAVVDNETGLLPLYLKRRPEAAEIMNYLTHTYLAGRIDRVLAFDDAYLVDPSERGEMTRRRHLLYEIRNPVFIRAAIAKFSKPGTHFIAVGAGHLIGYSGLVLGLRRAGFVVEVCEDQACATP